MEKAIQKAIEGGYKFHFFTGEAIQKFPDGTFAPALFSKELLDPEFWKCLGKVLGWEKHHCLSGCGCEDEPVPGHEGSCAWSGTGDWQDKWHDFIDHLSDGGNVDDFFNNLIK